MSNGLPNNAEQQLDQNYWDAKYQTKATGWDLGLVSPPIKAYIDTLQDKNIAILIPGCGNTYEASYLLEQGFTNITVIDIAPTLVKIIEEKFITNTHIQVLLGDYFQHQGRYDLIIEQTFFCALPPSMRQKYVWKTHDLLAENGILAGLLFNRIFNLGPPFGGSQKEYEPLFYSAFHFLNMDVAYNSIAPRANSELFIELQKNQNVTVELYALNGIKTAAVAQEISSEIAKMPAVLNTSINIDFTEIVIVSETVLDLKELQKTIATDGAYTITTIAL